MKTALPDDALFIWRAAVDRVRPHDLMRSYFDSHPELMQLIREAARVVVVGGGKAGSSMATSLEAILQDHLAKVEGVVNVPANAVRPPRKIRLHAARPAGSNHPTAEGVAGTEEMLALAASCSPNDLALVLLSGGGSALLPAPANGITLEDKQAVTKLLHACGATIQEMNCVRKHLSRFKGGGLAQAFRGKRMISLIISDVVGDPLDVIASGPTAEDPSTFQDARLVLSRYSLGAQSPPAVVEYLDRGARGEIPETLKHLPANVENVILGSNRLALEAVAREAEARGYRVLNLGSFVEGETSRVASVMSGLVRSIQKDGVPLPPPCCILVGGETTVTLPPQSGKGGRNQEFVLAMLDTLREAGMRGVCVLSGGTDGEDGPTDCAGAFADETIFARADGTSVRDHLERHDAYPLFERTGNLIKTGLTETNVMDVRVILVQKS
jgi:glycerate 2-kinase